jgi:hypothetical protein
MTVALEREVLMVSPVARLSNDFIEGLDWVVLPGLVHHEVCRFMDLNILADCVEATMSATRRGAVNRPPRACEYI